MATSDQSNLHGFLRTAIDGDPESIDRLLVHCRPLMKVAAERYMRRTNWRRFDSSDVVQQACLEAFAGFAKFQGRSEREFLAWLSTILRRTLARLAQHHTTEKRSVFREQQMPLQHEVAGDSSLCIPWNCVSTANAGPVTQVIAGERALLLASALQQLPDSYRSVLQLRFIDGMKVREIASDLNMSLGSVAGLLRRALACLCESLPPTLREELEGSRS